jgi:hypothetical protein
VRGFRRRKSRATRVRRASDNRSSPSAANGTDPCGEIVIELDKLGYRNERDTVFSPTSIASMEGEPPPGAKTHQRPRRSLVRRAGGVASPYGAASIPSSQGRAVFPPPR